ncbi:MAG: alpha/beta hydrolase [Acidobacteriota bacterium]
MTADSLSASSVHDRPVPPQPPRGWQNWVSQRLFSALSPRLKRPNLPPTPERLQPFEEVAIPRRGRGGQLAGIFFPAQPEAVDGGPEAVHRGAVLLGHPWMEWGQTYFHRRGRIETLRRRGYDVLTYDLSGFGASAAPQGFFQLDVEDALEWLHQRVPQGALHCWGVSSGGYWMHPVLAARRGAAQRVGGAMFEDVSPHLIEWSGNTAPHGIPFYLCFRHVTPTAYRFFDLREHAATFDLAAVSYVVGDQDRGIPTADARELARRSGAEILVVPEAKHLSAIKRAQHEVLALAVETFRKAEEAGSQAQ